MVTKTGRSSSGRTHGSEPCNPGSNPGLPAFVGINRFLAKGESALGGESKPGSKHMTKMEIIILDNLDKRYKEKWYKQFVLPQRKNAEGLWRRTQEEEIKVQSGWISKNDQRRRMIHFLDEYDVLEKNGKCQLVIKNVYLWLCTSLPKTEINEYLDRIYYIAQLHNWSKSENLLIKDDLKISISLNDQHPEDKKEGRQFPNNYQTLELVVSNDPFFGPNKNSPWDVLKSGIRKKGTRTKTPNIIENLEELNKFAPFQFELGGGASIELGIPPLNHLHDIYYVNNLHTNQFIFGKDDNLIPDILEDYEKFYRERASIAYKKSLLAEPNEFYLLLMDLYSKGIAVGDIITNNFDGLASLVNIKERYVRKYEDTDIVPNIKFHKDAKSLIVVGSHADRRLIQEAGRKNGLKIIYVDPEKYMDYKGNSIDYPLETLKDEDLLVQMTAVEFAKKYKKFLNL